MSNKAIGVFDSGVGGLTAVKEIKKLMPNENIIYLGDTGRVPYGTRSNETIAMYTKQDIDFLKTKDIKAIVVACGTASSVGLEGICETTVPIFDVIKPTVLKALELTKNNKIGVIGTTSTINSGKYVKLIAELGAKVTTYEKACPLFVPLVENGRIDKNDEVTNTVISEYLTELKNAGIDTLILGCTHYPLIADNILNFFEGKINLINPGKEVAKYLSENIELNQVKTIEKYYVTDDVINFAKNAKMFLEEDIADKIELTDMNIR